VAHVPPAVSVVMPYRDAARTLVASVRSMLAQSDPDFELLCVDDGSQDAGPALLRQLAARDARIRLLRCCGQGLVAALNAALDAARAPLVARMDADDVAHPERLALQRHFLARHAEVSLVASRVVAFPRNEMGEGMRYYLQWQDGCLSPRRIAEQIYLESPLVHPTVMFRTDCVRRLGGYRDAREPEDYELWLRMSRHGLNMAKLPQRLLRWRQHAGSHSRVHPRYARDAFDALRARYLATDPRVREARELVIWGAGRRTRKRVAHLLAHGFSPAAWIDIDPRKIGSRLHGAPVHAPGWLASRPVRPVVLAYVANHGAQRAIRRSLTGMGYRTGRDYLPVG
jgi:hypothetical protein